MSEHKESLLSSTKDRMDPRLHRILEVLPPAKDFDTRRATPSQIIAKIEPTNQLYMIGILGVPNSRFPEGVPRSITGIDGNKIDIKIYYPARATPGHLPGCVYFHGGGMGFFRMKDYDAYYRYLASFGMVVIGVDFRNSPTAPFPAGLNDCFSAVLWTSDHAHELRIDSAKLIVGGESGGANFAAATCILAAEKKLNIIKGQFLNCPYLSYDNRFKSRETNKNLIGPSNTADMLAQSYTPTPQGASNYLAWPVLAPIEKLRGLPPALVMVNEYDPLVDEGEAYGSMLAKAGVPVVSMKSNGTIHGSALMLQMLPDVASATVGMLLGWLATLEGLKRSKL